MLTYDFPTLRDCWFMCLIEELMKIFTRGVGKLTMLPFIPNKNMSRYVAERTFISSFRKVNINTI